MWTWLSCVSTCWAWWRRPCSRRTSRSGCDRSRRQQEAPDERRTEPGDDSSEHTWGPQYAPAWTLAVGCARRLGGADAADPDPQCGHDPTLLHCAANTLSARPIVLRSSIECA